jgi:WD40 repeat protein
LDTGNAVLETTCFYGVPNLIAQDPPILGAFSGFFTLDLWNLATGQKTEINNLEWLSCGGITGLFPVPNQGRFITTSRDHTLWVWQGQSGKQIHKLKGHQDLINQVVLSTDGARAASVSDDFSIIVWDLASGDRLDVFTATAL